MRTVETTAYLFDELGDRAKEKARDWYRAGGMDYDWWDGVYMQVEDAARILGVEFDRHKTNNPKAVGGPKIYFSGFYHQGQGSAFEGSYRYAKGAAKAIRAEFPTDKELHRIADDLQAVQARAFYALSAAISARRDTDISVSVEDTRHNYGWCTDDLERELRDILRAFNDWIFSALLAEYEYLTSDESVDESLRVHGCEFTEDGEIA